MPVGCFAFHLSIKVDIKRAPQKNTKKYIGFGLGIVGLVAITIVLVNLKPAAQSVDKEQLIFGTVKQGDMVRDVSAPGTLVPEHIRIIAATTAGRVEALPLRPGAAVLATTVIAELSNPDVELQVLQYDQTLQNAISNQANLRSSLAQQRISQENALAGLKTQYRAAERAAAVQDSLDKRSMASRNELAAAHDLADELKTRLDLETRRLVEMDRSAKEQIALNDQLVAGTRAILEEQKRRKLSMRVLAGEAGVLQTLPLEYGQWVNPGFELARVAQPGRLKAVLRVPDVQAKDILVGQSVVIDLHNNSTVKGHVIRTDPSAQAGNVTVEVGLDGPLPAGVRAEQTVDGRIEIENLRNIMHVERPTYGQAPGQVGLWKVSPDGKEATMVTVELGTASVSAVQVKRGLAVGDKIIVSDMGQYDDATRIRIK